MELRRNRCNLRHEDAQSSISESIFIHQYMIGTRRISKQKRSEEGGNGRCEEGGNGGRGIWLYDKWVRADGAFSRASQGHTIIAPPLDPDHRSPGEVQNQMNTMV
ncbi:hypothetical protein L1887_28601 [Cichorium endivia]|nr:hypothetical protein L1887_28601 [Cichorium endivia]